MRATRMLLSMLCVLCYSHCMNSARSMAGLRHHILNMRPMRTITWSQRDIAVNEIGLEITFDAWGATLQTAAAPTRTPRRRMPRPWPAGKADDTCCAAPHVPATNHRKMQPVLAPLACSHSARLISEGRRLLLVVAVVVAVFPISC